MKLGISFRTAVRGNILLFCVLILFHIFVMAGIVPSDIVWGGKVASRSELIRLETISIGVMLICLLITVMKAKCIKAKTLNFIVNAAIWLMVPLFLLNTIGNIFAVTIYEKLLFTPVTIALTFFSLRTALE